MVDGRGSGRLARRQKRLEKLRAKEAVAREERQARKQLVKVSWAVSIVAGPCPWYEYQIAEVIYMTPSAARCRRTTPTPLGCLVLSNTLQLLAACSSYPKI